MFDKQSDTWCWLQRFECVNNDFKVKNVVAKSNQDYSYLYMMSNYLNFQTFEDRVLKIRSFLCFPFYFETILDT